MELKHSSPSKKTFTNVSTIGLNVHEEESMGTPGPQASLYTLS